VICGVKLNTEEEFEELVSERIRKVDKITGTITVIMRISSNRTKGGYRFFGINGPDGFVYLLTEAIVNLVRGFNEE
jgi:hypothetical protein